MPRIWSEAHPMDRLSPHTWPCRRALSRPSGAAAALAIVAGLAAPLALPVSLARQSDSQQQQQGGPNEQQQGGQEDPAPAPPPATPPSQPSGDGGLRGLWKGIRGGNQPAPAQPAQPGSGAVQPIAQPAAQPAAAAPAAPVAKGKPGEFIPLPPFAEDVDLFAFAEWAAKYLDVNIFIDPALSGHTVRFTGPMQIKHEDLLELLAFLLEEQGFGLVREREGWYSIRASGDVKVHPGDDEFATTRVIFTPLVRPSSIQAAVTGAVSRATGAGAPGAPAASKMTFVDELGAIIITDTPRTIRQVEAIVDLIVTEFAALPLHRFPLTHLSADVARSRIVMLTGGGATGGSAAGGLIANPNQQVGMPTPLTGGGSLSSLRDRLLVDGSSNSLILRGSDQEATTVASLIEMVDTPSRLIGKRYPAGPASGTIASIGESEGLGAVTQGQTSNRTGQFGMQQLQQFQQPQASRAGASGASEGSRFIVEEDAFFYFGTDEQHKRVQALVDTYADQARAARVVVELYKLKHANAEDVAELLNSLLERAGLASQTPFLPGQDRSGRNSRTTGRDRNRAATSQDESALQRSRAAAGNLTRDNPDRSSSSDASSSTAAEGDGMGLTSTEDISIFPDVARNQLIVKAPVKQQEEIAAIITKLDMRRPQVYLEAKIVVVRAKDNFQFSVETQFTPGQSVLFTNFGLTTAGTAVPPGQAAQAARQVATGLNGLTAAIIKSDYVPIVINALQTVGDTRILSNPQLLVNDNEEAELISVREEPYAVTTTNASTTNTGQGGTAEAGTKLTVTPQISDAGLLNLEYAVELSAFDRSTAQQEGLQPPKQTENYKSVVTLPSDATMVIGGLTTENLTKSVRKVPFLGDIPIIGELFKSTTKDTTRDTIYVFIRPVIVRDPNSGDLRLLTRGPMEEMKLAPDTPDLEPARIPISAGGLGGPAPRPADARREDLELRPVRPGENE